MLSDVISISLINIRSLRSNIVLLLAYLKIKPISIIGITETWISIDDTDIFSVCCEAGYNLYLQPRNYGRGGGVGILIHMDLPTPSISSVTFSYSDCLSCTFNFPFDILRIIVIYRPPRPDYSIFFDEFSDCINNGLHSSSFKFICMGDFNYHFNSMSQPHSLFRQLTESLGLHQHISCPTHTSGNILDLIFTPNDTPTQFISPCIRSDLLTDHYLIHTSISLRKPVSTKSLVFYRELRKLNYHELGLQIENRLSSDHISFDFLNYCLSSTLNNLVPLKSRYFTLHTSSPWFSSHLAIMKRSLRKLERRIHQSSYHKYIFLEARMAYKKAIYSQKANFYEQKLNACGSNSQKIFKIVNRILGSNLNPISNRLSDYNMCSSFVSSLYNKLSSISKCIKSKLALIPPSMIAHQITEPTLCKLSSFSSPSIFEIHKLIMMSNSTSPIDPLPLVVFKNLVLLLSITISNLISESLNDGIMAKSLKYAIIKPILKKSCLDPDDLMNYRPISQLPIISKIMERVVSRQLIFYLENNYLMEPYQSAYRKHYSTETALNIITDTLYKSLDSSHCAQLLLLDLSSAFDTLNHNILIERFKELGIEGSSLSWLTSFLNDRTSSVKVNDYISPPIDILCGVPQGSVLGPLLFSIYLRPLSNIISKFPNITYHIYADDIQLIIKIPVNSLNSNLELLECASDIINWLLRNDLLVNTSKTELLNVSRVYTTFPPVIIDGRVIHPSASVRNLGVIFDSTLSFDAHINSISKSANFHLRRIRHIRKYCSISVLLNYLLML